MIRLLTLLALVVGPGFPAAGVLEAVPNPRIAEEEESQPVPAAPALRRVALLGASASAGYAVAVDLGTAFGLQLRVEPERVLNLGDAMFFTRPDAMARAQVERAVEFEPTLVVAVDFLFWMAYGFQEESQRPERLERGLALLEQLDAPLVVATLPDMRQSVGRMLAPGQVPTRATLAALNRRILSWAEDHDAVVVDLARLVRSFLGGESLDIAGTSWPAEEGTPLLLRDRLHPNSAGQAAMVTAVGEQLVSAGWVPEGALHLDVVRTHRGIVALEEEDLERRRQQREERRRARREGRKPAR